jgi:hypothetical protein
MAMISNVANHQRQLAVLFDARADYFFRRGIFCLGASDRTRFAADLLKGDSVFGRNFRAQALSGASERWCIQVETAMALNPPHFSRGFSEGGVTSTEPSMMPLS